MRKNDRQITDFNEVLAVLDGCQTVRLALHDSPYPYIVPLSFGREVKEARRTVIGR